MIGESIKEFKITSLLGRGGMGEVYVAVQQIVQTKVAIKLLRDTISGDRTHVQRFFNEAITASKIKHAGIVKIFDVGFHGERAFLIMEFLDGESLTARMRRPPRMSLSEIVDIARQLAGILEATHAVGITHRDLKPDNVFLVEDAELPSRRRVKVLDFGIAKLAPATAETAPAPGAGTSGTSETALPGATAMTLTNSSMGTPGYMAPEQWTDAASAGAKADVYALGCVLFELCCGRPPFEATSMAEACAKHLGEVPPRIRTLLPELPERLDDLVAAMLAKKPDERPAMSDVGAILDGIAAELPVTGVRTGPPTGARTVPATGPTTVKEAATSETGTTTSSAPPPARSGRLAWAAVSVGFAVAVGGGVYLATRPDAPSTPASTPPASNSPASTSTTSNAPTSRPVTRSIATAPSTIGCPDGMVRVSPGTFTMGNDTGMDWEKPVHEVTISRPFCIDRTEVTVAAYSACAAKGACEPAPTTVHIEGMRPEQVPVFSQFCNGAREDRATHPINCITWTQASAYCAAAGKRLPTEAEWELAARGSDGRRYPWGNDAPDAKHLNLCGTECREYAKRKLNLNWYIAYDDSDGWATTAPVGSYPAGASPSGALDMAGNVAEWIADVYGEYDAAAVTDPGGPPSGPRHVGKDTSWRDPKIDFARSTNRMQLLPTQVDDQIGFRCAADAAVATPHRRGGAP